MTAHEARQETLLYWLALHLTPGLGAQRALRLVKVFGHPERIFHASLSELEAAMPQLPKATAESIHAGIAFEEAADEQRKAEGAGVAVVPYQDPRYPARLREIYDPPILLYVRGRAELLQGHTLAVVGTRNPTPYGKAVAEKLSREMVRMGLTHVSGMARGVDACSHRGVLSAPDRALLSRAATAIRDLLRNEALVSLDHPDGTVPISETGWFDDSFVYLTAPTMAGIAHAAEADLGRLFDLLQVQDLLKPGGERGFQYKLPSRVPGRPRAYRISRDVLRFAAAGQS